MILILAQEITYRHYLRDNGFNPKYFRRIWELEDLDGINMQEVDDILDLARGMMQSPLHVCSNVGYDYERVAKKSQCLAKLRENKRGYARVKTHSDYERAMCYQYANESSVEFTVLSCDSPEYTYQLLSICSEKGFNLDTANLHTPRGTLEAWAGCIEYEEFSKRF